MFRSKANLLVELAEHGLFRRFAPFDAALRELPRVLANPLAPEDFVDPVDQNDADVGAVAVSIQHTATLNSCHKLEMIIAMDGQTDESFSIPPCYA